MGIPFEQCADRRELELHWKTGSQDALDLQYELWKVGKIRCLSKQSVSGSRKR